MQMQMKIATLYDCSVIFVDGPIDFISFIKEYGWSFEEITVTDEMFNTISERPGFYIVEVEFDINNFDCNNGETYLRIINARLVNTYA